MGLIKAAVGAARGVLADQWKEYFYCESLPADVLVVKGQKKVSGRSANRRGSDNVITNNSVIAVADGQCMIIVDQGQIIDLCAEPGEYIYDMSTEPSLFDGGRLSDNIEAVFQSIGYRFSFGGAAPKDQRIYYFNTKEIMGNKYGTPSPIPFRVVDARAGIDIDISVKCFGEYSYRITNPMLFYKNVCGNVAEDYCRSDLEGQLRSELLTALQPAFARISEMGIRYSSVPSHAAELSRALAEELTAEWKERRGIEIQKIGVSSIKADEADEQMLKEMQKTAAFRDPTLAAAYLAGAQGAAMQEAAKNANGAAMGFMGMNTAAQGGMNPQSLYQMGQQQEAVRQQASPAPAPSADTWVCPSCQTTVSGKFCGECGTKRPEAGPWTCSCGTVNQGKFCMECGAKRP